MEELGKQPYGMDNLKEDVSSLKASIKELDVEMKKLIKILRGPEDTDEPAGLIHNVYMNSQFRRIVIAWLWLLTGSVLTIGAQVFFNIISKLAE